MVLGAFRAGLLRKGLGVPSRHRRRRLGELGAQPGLPRRGLLGLAVQLRAVGGLVPGMALGPLPQQRAMRLDQAVVVGVPPGKLLRQVAGLGLVPGQALGG